MSGHLIVCQQFCLYSVRLMDFSFVLIQYSFAMNSRVASVDSDEEYYCNCINHD